MKQIPRLMAAHLFLAAIGTAYTIPSAGTVSATGLPGKDDASWTYLGNTKELSVEPSSDSVEHWGVTDTGELVLDDIREIKKQIKFTFTLADIGPLAIQNLFHTDALNEASTEGTPLSPEAPEPKYWMKVQYVDKATGTPLVGVFWVSLKATGSMKVDATNWAEVQFEARLLKSALNKIGPANEA